MKKILYPLYLYAMPLLIIIQKVRGIKTIRLEHSSIFSSPYKKRKKYAHTYRVCQCTIKNKKCMLEKKFFNLFYSFYFSFILSYNNKFVLRRNSRNFIFSIASIGSVSLKIYYSCQEARREENWTTSNEKLFSKNEFWQKCLLSGRCDLKFMDCYNAKKRR